MGWKRWGIFSSLDTNLPCFCCFFFPSSGSFHQWPGRDCHPTYLENIKVIKDNSKRMGSKEQAGGHPIYFWGWGPHHEGLVQFCMMSHNWYHNSIDIWQWGRKEESGWLWWIWQVFHQHGFLCLVPICIVINGKQAARCPPTMQYALLQYTLLKYTLLQYKLYYNLLSPNNAIYSVSIYSASIQSASKYSD